MRDLSFPTRDQTCVPCLGRQILNHGTTAESPSVLFLKGNLCLLMFSFQREDLCFRYNSEKFQLRHLLVKIGEKSLPCSPSYWYNPLTLKKVVLEVQLRGPQSAVSKSPISVPPVALRWNNTTPEAPASRPQASSTSIHTNQKSNDTSIYYLWGLLQAPSLFNTLVFLPVN